MLYRNNQVYGVLVFLLAQLHIERKSDNESDFSLIVTNYAIAFNASSSSSSLLGVIYLILLFLYLITYSFQ